MQDAFSELGPLGDGVQLTPGCAPTVGFSEWLAAQKTAVRTHHGFTPHAFRTRVWDEGLRPVGAWHSVHPPRRATLDAVLRNSASTCLEVMYPGELLGDGAEVEAAMEAGLDLAVDVSHVFIQLSRGAMTPRTWRKLQDYTGLSEVHVSANDGARDQHQPISRNSFGLDWARDRARAGTPAIIESYFHHLNSGERCAQVALVRGEKR